MPGALGYSGIEVIDMLKAYTGNKSADFENYLSYELPLAEFRYCLKHDWTFLYKLGLPLPVQSGTQEYILSVNTTSSTGYYISTNDIITITDRANNTILRKTTSDEIRRMDPNNDDGSSNDNIRYWAPSGDNTILVYPKTFNATTLYVDAKITPATAPRVTIQGIVWEAASPNYRLNISYVIPSASSVPLSHTIFQNAVTINLATDGSGNVSSNNSAILSYAQLTPSLAAVLSASPISFSSLSVIPVAQGATPITKIFSIPYRLQGTFIEWLKGIVLDRENDSRATGQINEAKILVRDDISDDLAGLGDTIQPRIKATWEQYMDGNQQNIDQAYLFWMFYGSDY